jgi:acyl-CoA reductase-like NAD-dependent aldehyde dehydrogenase
VQPAWAATPIKKRLAVIRKFRELVVERMPELARTLSLEVGKPIRQSRKKLNGLTGRIDFFLEETERALREEKVFDDDASKTEERIAHEPLGVDRQHLGVELPYFVGGNVFVPALAAGNAVLYKPSEFATLTGMHIADMLHAAGVPEDVFAVVIGDGKTGAALLAQPSTACSSRARTAPAARSPRARGRRMIKTQLELGGKDPIYVTEDVDVQGRGGRRRGRRVLQHRTVVLLGRAHLRPREHLRRVRRRVRAEVKGFKVGDPLDEQRTSARSRASRSSRC